MRISEEERTRNRAFRSRLTKSIKTLKDCKTKSEADKDMKGVISIIDQACQKNLIHKNKAAREKSKLMTLYNKLSN